jgi:hypothetical protein
MSEAGSGRMPYRSRRRGNSGADSCKLNICTSIEHIYKCWAEVIQMPPISPIPSRIVFNCKKTET